MQISNKVLVAFASKYGATAEIANRVGQIIRKEGFEVDVLPFNRVVDLAQYKAVIISSAVYIGQWRKEAVKFVTQNEKLLTERQVWIFSSGPTGEGDAMELMSGWKYPGKLKPAIERIHPNDIAVFHGLIDMKRLNFMERFMINRVKAASGDFRKWDAVDKWAAGIAKALKV
ncbi:MAG: flavodoxin domain-containing protein [Chloroflexota bacterium]